MLQLQCIIKAKGRLGTPTSNGNGVQPKKARGRRLAEEGSRKEEKQKQEEGLVIPGEEKKTISIF